MPPRSPAYCAASRRASRSPSPSPSPSPPSSSSTSGSGSVASPAVPTFTSSDGFDVAAWDLGGDGPPVLMAHATGFHGLVWRPMAAALPDFRCYSFDERGHGDSFRPPGHDYDWIGFADDALTVVDGLGLGHPFGIGHSAGAAALLMAEAFRPGT